MAPLYRLEAIRMAYGPRTVLDIPVLEIGEGCRTYLVGPNGAGKSTLLSLLAFLSPPVSGILRFDGAPVVWTPVPLHRLRREATLLHQSPYLFHESVFENVAFGLSARGIAGALRRRRVAEALETVGLTGFEHRKAQALSGGEAQRVAMARALSLSPRVLLLDEPFSNVDRGTADVLHASIAALAARGTTVVTATHEVLPSREAGARIVRLAEGRLCGDPILGQNGSDTSPGDRRVDHLSPGPRPDTR